jgi:hypothetical protein
MQCFFILKNKMDDEPPLKKIERQTYLVNPLASTYLFIRPGGQAIFLTQTLDPLLCLYII